MARIKFYGNGTIWDDKKSTALLTFEKHAGGSMYLGAVIVEDDYTVKRMQELGHKNPENEGVIKAGGWEALAELSVSPKRSKKKKEEKREEVLPVELVDGETAE